MIVKFAKPGKSFKGVMLYLTHDPDHAATSERVAWTHTLNLANDDIPAALHEMHTTALNAPVLKAEQGIGGRQTEKPVKHFSLNWHPSETPDREEMIGAVQSFLAHMGWDQHQAIVTAHTDKAYRHVHVVLNAVHPETGLKLDDGFERRRAQAWALAYEQERGQDFCPQRSRPAAEREAGEPRPAWLANKEHSQRAAEAELRDFDTSYLAREENRRIIERREWQILKELQRQERLAFFEEGREVYRDLNRSIYREVREEFRREWASYYAAKRERVDGGQLADMRADLIALQKDVLDERRDAVIAEKRDERDFQYRALLDRQKMERGELIDRQEQGLRSPHLLDRAYPLGVDEAAEAANAPSLEEVLDRFGIRRGRAVRQEEQERGPRHEDNLPPANAGEQPLLPHPVGNPETAPSRDLGTGLAGGILGALGSLGDSLLGGHSKPKKSPQLERFGIRRGQPPPGDANERAAREQRQAYEDWQEWKERHGLAQER